MGNIQDQYLDRVRREEVAPSGQRFIYHMATMAEVLAALGGIPAVTQKESQNGADRSGEVAFTHALLSSCVEYPRLLLDGQDALDGDWLPISALRQCDVTWLLERVQKPVNADALDQARRVL